MMYEFAALHSYIWSAAAGQPDRRVRWLTLTLRVCCRTLTTSLYLSLIQPVDTSVFWLKISGQCLWSAQAIQTCQCREVKRHAEATGNIHLGFLRYRYRGRPTLGWCPYQVLPELEHSFVRHQDDWAGGSFKP